MSTLDPAARRALRRRVWSAPIALGVISALGLTTALVGDDAWDVASWFALAVPAVVGTWFSVRR